MKFIVTTIAIIVFVTGFAKAQTPGPVELKLADSICHCIARLDVGAITSKQEGVAAFTNCVAKYPDLLLATAKERNIEIDDTEGMRKIGIDIGFNLLRSNCPGYMAISGKMASSVVTNKSFGKLIRIDTKGLNYFVISDAAGKEESFVWLHQFAGSSVFTNGPGSYTGKRVAIKWQETEIYLPIAKGYYNVKEILSLDVQ